MLDILLLLKETGRFLSRHKRINIELASESKKEHRIRWTSRPSPSFLGLFLHVILIFTLIYALFRSFYTIKWPCCNINDCVVWLLSWNHFTIALLIQLSALFIRRNCTYSCAQKIRELIFFCHENQRESRYNIFSYFTSLTFCLFIVVYLNFRIKLITDIFVAMSYLVARLLPLAMECLFLLFCSAVHDVCNQIYYEQRKLLRVQEYHNSILFNQKTKKFMLYHQMIANALITITKCFEKDLLVDLSFNMMWFVIYFYFITVTLFTSGKWDEKLSLMLDSSFIAVRGCFLSYYIDQMSNRGFAKFVSPWTEFLEFKIGTKCEISCSWIGCIFPTFFQYKMKIEKVDQFLRQLMENDMRMNVCGLFNLNLSFTRGVVSLATTYLIIFIQYGFTDDAPTAQRNSINSTHG